MKIVESVGMRNLFAKTAVGKRTKPRMARKHRAAWRRCRAFLAVAMLACLAASAAGCTTFPLRGRQVLRAVSGYEHPAHPVGGPEFETTLDAATQSAAHPESSAKLLQNGDEAYPAMLDLIASAKTRISMETYIVCKDGTTDRFFQALKDAARRGVEVRLLVDAAGYERGLVAELSEMSSQNIQARVFNPFLMSWTLIRGNNRDHRKILVVDGHYAVMGGINLSDEQLGDGVSGWRDTALLVAGPAAADAEAIFAETWEQGGRGWFGKTLPVTVLNPFKKAADAPFLLLHEKITDQSPFVPPEYAAPGEPDVFPDDFYDTRLASVRAVGSSPDTWGSATHDAVVAAIQGARERIDAAYAYFVPPRDVRRALIAAAKRGVKIRLLLPRVSDVRFVREIGMKRYGELLEAGVEIYEWPHRILHAKTMAVDGRWLVVGSANMDSRSYFLNYEAVFCASDKALAEVAHRRFEADLVESTQLTFETWKRRGAKQRLLEVFLTPLAGQF